MTMPTHAVTEASGQLGRLAVQELLGGPAFDLPELAGVISEDTDTAVIYRDLPVEEYTSWLQDAGLDEPSASFVAALDASIAHGDLETQSEDLARLLGRPATPLTDVLGAARGGEST
jgi:NAD(P)H dehydrogenase (quinone)